MKVAQAKLEMIKPDEVNMEEYEVSISYALIIISEAEICLYKFLLVSDWEVKAIYLFKGPLFVQRLLLS